MGNVGRLVVVLLGASGCGGAAFKPGACVTQTDAGCTWVPAVSCVGTATGCREAARFTTDAGPTCVASPDTTKCL